MHYVIWIWIVLYLILKHDFYKNISSDVNKWFDTSNYSNNINRPLEKNINKKVIGKFKDELGGKILSEFVGLGAKTFSYTQIDGDKIDETKKAMIK